MTIADSVPVSLENEHHHEDGKQEIIQDHLTAIASEELWQEFTLHCRYGELEEMESMLKQNLPMIENFIKGNGNTPLHWAAINGHSSMCEFVIKNGATPTIRNNAGFSPATLAEQREFMECANVILKSYDPDEEEDDGAQEANDADVVLSSSDPEYQEYATR